MKAGLIVITIVVALWVWVFVSWSQTVEVPTEPAPSIIFAGGVSGAWMSVNRANLKDPNARGYDPSYTYITCQFKPIVTKKGDGWEITFVSEIAQNLP